MMERVYRKLLRRWGPQGWWPAETRFEVMAGAVLTQNTAWSNVERAIANLKRERLLSPRKIQDCPDGRLEAALTPSGYFRVKAKRLRSFCAYLLERHGGSRTRTAADLGISRNTLWRKLRRYGIH